MKNFWILIVFLCFNLFQSQVKEPLVIPKNAKIGLSLSGGGAKGFSHVGVLKVIDSLGIKIDYISGTSMGAIIGGMYAAGYTGKDIEKIVMDTDFYSLITDPTSRKDATFFNKSVDKYLLNIPLKNGKASFPSSISTGQRNVYMLKEILKNVSTVTDFSKLPIPFLCVATNLESGNMQIFEQGDLVQSIMASSAFPSLLEPVKINDSLYVDGAMTVNYPSKPLKEKGMDIVIGVDLNQGLAKRDDLKSMISILNQIIDFGIQRDTKRQYKYTDINIKPDLTGMTATSYDNKKSILDSGYVAAHRYETVLDRLPKREYERLRVPINPIYSNVYKIDSLVLENGKIYGKNYVLGKMGLRTPSMQTYGSVNKMIDKLYATNNYRIINYDIVQNAETNYLKIQVTEDDTRHFIKFGLHYDEIFKTGLLLNYSAKRLLFKNTDLSLDLVVGDKPRYYFNYFIDNGYIPGFGLYASGMSFELLNKSKNVIEDWKWFRNEAYLQSIWKDRYALGGGISFDYFDTEDAAGQNYNSDRYLNLYAFVKSDTQDDKDFPTRGFYLNGEVKVLDVFSNELEKKPVQAKADIRMSFRLSKKFTYRLNLFGGFSFGEVIPHFYQYRLGGIFEQNFNNIKAMSGYQFGQINDNNLIYASNDVQFRFNKNYYIIGNFSIANMFNDFGLEDTAKISFSSVGITAGYKSPFGQIKLNFSQSINKQKGIFSVILGHWF